MPQPHIQVILGDDTIPGPLQAALRRTQASTSFRPLSEVLRSGLTPWADAVVVVAPNDTQSGESRLRVLFDRMADHPRATLVLSETGSAARLRHPPTVPVSFASALGEDELALRLSLMLDMRQSLASLHRETLTNRGAEQKAARRYVNQLRLASQVQREFLPEVMPCYGPVSFTSVYRPVDYVSGDIYDIQRLDEEHVGVALADATGHGIPAALLTVFIKRALRGKEIQNGAYRILPPDEVLRRLNDDILDANLSQCRFVAAVYVVLNIRTLEMSIARGGSPYPVLRRADGTTELVRAVGGVVGVLPDATFATERIQLQAGDSLVLYTDGLEKLIVPQTPGHALAEAFARVTESATDATEFEAELVEQDAGGKSLSPEFSLTAWPADTGVATSGSVATLVKTGSSVGVLERPSTERLDASGHRPRLSFKPGAGRRALVGHRSATTASARRPAALAALALSPDELVAQSSWFDTLRCAGAREALAQLDARYETLRRIGHPLDDLTALAINISE